MKIDPANLNRREAHELFVGAILPRPIAWVSTVGRDGVYNIAPFSFFTGMSVKPPVVGFAVGSKRDGGQKDTLANIEFSKEYVINVVTDTLGEAMNQTSGEYPSHVDEFQVANLIPLKCDLVKPPRVAESPVNMECRLLQILEFGEAPHVNAFIIGEVLRVHIKDDLWIDGVIKGSSLKGIGRMGEDLYCRTMDIFEMKRPRGPF
jgi:flavin reductase (DIM6/NTAB) family NADH-FMN oxidoreductase RutF